MLVCRVRDLSGREACFKPSTALVLKARSPTTLTCRCTVNFRAHIISNGSTCAQGGGDDCRAKNKQDLLKCDS